MEEDPLLPRAHAPGPLAKNATREISWRAAAEWWRTARNREVLELSFEKLQLDYIDLFGFHGQSFPSFPLRHHSQRP